ncbi:Uncharacterised protein [uncultured Clostridium sp.]|nr:Uncharacterised protein [uncultured Clostridium sp.]
MEMIIAIICVILLFIIIKYLLKKLVFALILVGVTGIISYIYKVPYIISLCSILILLYSIYSIFSEVKFFGYNIIRPCRLYINGFYEKIVTLLFSLNYIVFMSICYITLMSISFSMIDIVELATAFIFTWIFVWLVLHTRSLLFSIIERASLYD